MGIKAPCRPEHRTTGLGFQGGGAQLPGPLRLLLPSENLPPIVVPGAVLLWPAASSTPEVAAFQPGPWTEGGGDASKGSRSPEVRGNVGTLGLLRLQKRRRGSWRPQRQRLSARSAAGGKSVAGRRCEGHRVGHLQYTSRWTDVWTIVWQSPRQILVPRVVTWALVTCRMLWLGKDRMFPRLVSSPFHSTLPFGQSREQLSWMDPPSSTSGSRGSTVSAGLVLGSGPGGRERNGP